MSKTNIGLVEYCKAQLGRPYWMGTFGQIATADLYKYNKGRLPQYYTATDFPSQYGQRVHDCIGMVKGYIWSDGPDAVPKYGVGCPDIDQAQMLKNATEKGKIATLPEIPGILVFLPGHVGVYIGGGEVIEARGHAYGVVKTKLAGRGWTDWAKCPYISYVDAAPEPEPEPEPENAEPSEWAEAACKRMIDAGIIRGDGDDNFRWHDDITREEMAVIADRVIRLVEQKIETALEPTVSDR